MTVFINLIKHLAPLTTLSSTPLKSSLISQLKTLSSSNKTVLTATENYYSLLKDINERKELHNLDQGGEKKLGLREITRRSAARSGFHLPDEYKAE